MHINTVIPLSRLDSREQDVYLSYGHLSLVCIKLISATVHSACKHILPLTKVNYHEHRGELSTCCGICLNCTVYTSWSWPANLKVYS